jgi:UDP-4-amino-4,6-dideoxy-N-acetyl-beta-L-altrosamine N-acetyltransferase
VDTLHDDRLRPLVDDDESRLFGWRNAPAVYAHLFAAAPVAADGHRAWFAALRADEHRHARIFERDGKPVGFVNIGPVAPGGVAAWGFYKAPGAPAGTGLALGRATLRWVFEELRLHRLHGDVLGGNAASLALHRALGFVEEGRFRDHHFDGARHHDVVRFAVLAPEWRARAEAA